MPLCHQARTRSRFWFERLFWKRFWTTGRKVSQLRTALKTLSSLREGHRTRFSCRISSTPKQHVPNNNSGSQIVTMMRPAEPWHRYNSVPQNIGVDNCFTTGKSSLRKRKMSSVLVMVTAVLIRQAFQMTLIHNNDMVEQSRRQLPPQRSATPFCHRLRKLVRLGWMPKLFTVSITSLLNCAP